MNTGKTKKLIAISLAFSNLLMPLNYAFAGKYDLVKNSSEILDGKVNIVVSGCFKRYVDENNLQFTEEQAEHIEAFAKQVEDWQELLKYIQNEEYKQTPKEFRLNIIQPRPIMGKKKWCEVSSGICILDNLVPGQSYIPNYFQNLGVKLNVDECLGDIQSKWAIRQTLKNMGKDSEGMFYVLDHLDHAFFYKDNNTRPPSPCTEAQIGNWIDYRKNDLTTLESILKHYITNKKVPLIAQFIISNLDSRLQGNNHDIVVYGFRTNDSGKITDVLINFNTHEDMDSITISGVSAGEPNIRNSKYVSIDTFKRVCYSLDVVYLKN